MTSTISMALDQAIEKLSITFDPIDAKQDAQVLLAEITGYTPATLFAYGDVVLTLKESNRFHQAISARCQFQPVSQILGRRFFWKSKFMINHFVLDPRADTETLIEVVLGQGEFTKILDLGTGSGCIALSLLHEYPKATAVGGDISTDSVEIAIKNAQHLGLSDRFTSKYSDWFSHIDEKFDLIVSNPPYIASCEMDELSPEIVQWEPKIALTDEGNGLTYYKIIAQQAHQFLLSDGLLAVEIGHKQGRAVEKIFKEFGWRAVTIFQDINDKDRVVTARL